MKKDRLKRYAEKIDIIEERSSDTAEWIQNPEEKVKRLASYKAFQEVIEAIFDLVAMFLKDNDKVVEDDYTNLEKIRVIKILSNNDIDALIEVNGLRNRIIHRYNTTDDKIATESIKNLLPKIDGINKKFARTILLFLSIPKIMAGSEHTQD